MGLVLGLSMSSKAIRGVLVDGDTGDGVPVDHSVLDMAEGDEFDAEAFLEPLLAGDDVRAVGLTWSHDAEAAATKVREALEVLSAGSQVVAVPDVEAAEALARGIATLTGHEFLVVCIVEPDATVIAKVDGFHVTVECVGHVDSATLIDRAHAVVLSARPSPDAIFVLGSAGTDELVAALADATQQPVLTAAEADFALPRGAALVSARATNVDDAPAAGPRISRVRVLSSTLVAAVVVFVVSVALLVGQGPTTDSTARPTRSSAEVDTARPSTLTRKLWDMSPLAAQRAPVVPVAPPVPPVAPEAPPPAYVPPPPAAPVEASPVYVPAAPPPAVQPPAARPPAVPPVKPRLRDRILDKIPGFNRLH